MRERFEQQMEILHTELIELGALCEQAIGRTYEVLLEGNQRAAEEIIKKIRLSMRKNGRSRISASASFYSSSR